MHYHVFIHLNACTRPFHYGHPCLFHRLTFFGSCPSVWCAMARDGSYHHLREHILCLAASYACAHASSMYARFQQSLRLVLGTKWIAVSAKRVICCACTLSITPPRYVLYFRMVRELLCSDAPAIHISGAGAADAERWHFCSDSSRRWLNAMQSQTLTSVCEGIAWCLQ